MPPGGAAAIIPDTKISTGTFPMAESHVAVVTGLVAKRAELAGRIEACRRELEHLEADVGHLDGAIKLWPRGL